jgi:proteasome accessory factor B
MRRIERLINLIAALLDTERPMTAQEIRERIAGYDQANFDAFRRAFERDKEALRSMGIPLETVTGVQDAIADQPDGYIIPKERYYLPQLDLEPDELAALRLTSDAVLGDGENVAAGFAKLSVDSAPASLTRPRVMWGADVAVEQPLLGPLYAAILSRAPVTFGYRSSGGDEQQRHLEPYGLVHKRGNWYVVGRDVDRDDVRAFRVSRVTSTIANVEGSFEVPDGFDAASHLGGEPYEVGSGTPTTAVIRFAPSLRWWAEQNIKNARARPQDDGSLEVEIPVGNVDALISWAIGFGAEMEIVSPEEARRALLGRLAPFLEAR